LLTITSPPFIQRRWGPVVRLPDRSTIRARGTGAQRPPACLISRTVAAPPRPRHARATIAGTRPAASREVRPPCANPRTSHRSPGRPALVDAQVCTNKKQPFHFMNPSSTLLSRPVYSDGRRLANRSVQSSESCLCDRGLAVAAGRESLRSRLVKVNLGPYRGNEFAKSLGAMAPRTCTRAQPSPGIHSPNLVPRRVRVTPIPSAVRRYSQTSIHKEVSLERYTSSTASTTPRFDLVTC